MAWLAAPRIAWACSACAYGRARRPELYYQATLIMLLPAFGLVAALATGLWHASRARALANSGRSADSDG